MNLLIKYYKEARHGVYLSTEEEEARAKRNEARASQGAEKSSVRTTEVKSKTSRGGSRCCICFDPFSIQNVSVTVFFCCHGYHTTCLMDSTSNVSGKKGSGATFRGPGQQYEYENGDVDDSDDDDASQSGASRMRCILCTTAAT